MPWAWRVVQVRLGLASRLRSNSPREVPGRYQERTISAAPVSALNCRSRSQCRGVMS
ncbi:hypothetical protein CNECB9_4040028 [Cupriavidus necator]|uniref:Uncharacterized protein n=1 Tax=Cupriavidus necator TaxID=106590 RepID=A0A1K0IJV6_CUPNE|nr:hypothetical protein CNECB9_4040028 [Cupriavidus necator]